METPPVPEPQNHPAATPARTDPSAVLDPATIRAAIWAAVHTCTDPVDRSGSPLTLPLIVFRAHLGLQQRFPDLGGAVIGMAVHRELAAILRDLGRQAEQPARSPVFDQEKTGIWAEKTFGRGEKMLPYARRVLAEAEELVNAAHEYDSRGYGLSEARGEAADVLITLRVFAHRFGFDLDDESDRKMDVNAYQREWIPAGDGTGRHKK
jgi:NTP pyrophosphatase (non-canonical NTP hydrolase)